MGGRKLSGNKRVPDDVFDASWYEEVLLPVAPACNMLCNFCSVDRDCICNGNDPDCDNRALTVKQAVELAVEVSRRGNGVKNVRIAGPCEPLFNLQTFEVLKRLRQHAVKLVPCIATNGLELPLKAVDIAELGVKAVDVCINAYSTDTARKLYTNIIKDKTVLTHPEEIHWVLLDSQLKGIEKCLSLDIQIRVFALYLPGINDGDLPAIAKTCGGMGVGHMCIISSAPGGKLSKYRAPDLGEMIRMKAELSKHIENIQIRSFMSAI